MNNLVRNVFLFAVPIIILLSFNNCSFNYKSYNNSASNPTQQALSSPTLQRLSARYGCTSFSSESDYKKVLKNSVGILSKVQYENSVRDIFGIRGFESDFERHLQTGRKRTLLGETSLTVKTHNAFSSSALKLLEEIDNNEEASERTYFCGCSFPRIVL